MRYDLNHSDIAWIEGTLSNDEDSTDAELQDYFQSNGLTAEQAIGVLSHRMDYLNDIVADGAGPLWDD